MTSWENREGQREVLLDALPISRGFDDFVDHCVLVGMVHEQEPNDGMPFARSGAVSTAILIAFLGSNYAERLAQVERHLVDASAKSELLVMMHGGADATQVAHEYIDLGRDKPC